MTSFNEFLADSKERDLYWVEDAKIGFALEMERQMKRQGINKRGVAMRLETSPAYITKVLRGDANVTIESMARLARAAGGDLHIHVAPRASRVRWLDVIGSQPAGDGSTDAAVAAWARQKKAGHGSIPLAA